MSMTEPGKGRLAEIKLGFIGVGNMGGAIIRGLLAGSFVARENLVYYDPDPARQAQMEETGGCGRPGQPRGDALAGGDAGRQTPGVGPRPGRGQRIRPALASDYFHRRRASPWRSWKRPSPTPG